MADDGSGQIIVVFSRLDVAINYLEGHGCRWQGADNSGLRPTSPCRWLIGTMWSLQAKENATKTRLVSGTNLGG